MSSVIIIAKVSNDSEVNPSYTLIQVLLKNEHVDEPTRCCEDARFFVNEFRAVILPPGDHLGHANANFVP